MLRSVLSVAAALLAVGLPAQSTVVVPNGYAAAEGIASTAYPWGRGTAPAGQIRVQYVYDGTHFTNQGIAGAITISRVRWRCNGASVAPGGTYNNVTIQMSTCPVDQAAVTTTFANNHGADLTTVYSGAVTVAAGAGTTPNNWYVDITLTTPFLYTPANGDLNIDLAHDAVGWIGTFGPPLDCQTTGSLVSRINNLSNWLSPTGTVQPAVGAVVEITYAQNGLFAGFSATPTAGASPLLVNFTDTSFSSDPGGITSWAWDLDGDSVIDSNLQNPSFLYASCGSYTVSLTVTDGSHAPNTLTRSNYIVTDDVAPDFAWALIAPGTVQFTDTSAPMPTSWAWDLDGDSVVDSNLQNPVWNYGGNCGAPVNVTLTVNRLCRGPFATTRPVIAADSLTTLFAGGNGGAAGWLVFFDANVAAAEGIGICKLAVNSTAAATTALTLNVYVTPGTWVGNDNNAAPWRLAGTASGTAAGSGLPSLLQLTAPVYLPSGSFGIALQWNGGGPSYTNGTGTNQNYGNADLLLSLGAVRSTFFAGGTFFTPRVWNGTLYYTRCATGGDAGYGFFGPGCAGSMPITSLRNTNRPQLGTTLSVDLDHLPAAAAIMMLGLSRTASSFGALPLELTAFGAPGCFGRVSPDNTTFVLGAGSAATWTLGIPNNGALLCMPFYNQALVLDPLFNTLGAVVSDAAAGMVGN